jgi:phage gp29-like protein
MADSIIMSALKSSAAWLGWGGSPTGTPEAPAIPPMDQGSPADADAKPSIGELVSRNPDYIQALGPWMKMIVENQDSILKRNGSATNLKLYDELLDDDVAFSTLQQRRLAITAKDWEVSPGDSDDPRSVQAADDLRAMLKAVGWDGVTAKMHYAIWYGYGVAEAMWTTKVYNGRQIVWLDDIIVPDRRWFGFTMEGELRFTGAISAIEGEQLPPNKFWTIRTGASHDFAFYGLGLAHWAYWPIFFKRSAIKFWALYLEKLAQPTVAIGFGIDVENDAAKKQKLLDAGVAIGRDSVVLIPEAQMTEQNLRIIQKQSGSSGSAPYGDFVTEQNEALMRINLGQPGTSKATAQGIGGAQAQVHDDVKDEIVKADSDLISETFTNTIARWLTTWNYGEDVAAPTVYRVLDDPIDIGETADTDVALAGIGIKRTPESVRSVYGDGYTIDAEPSMADKIALAKAQAGGVTIAGAPPAANDNPAAAEKAKIAKAKLQFDIDDAAPLYVSRTLLNAGDVIAWAKEQGFKTTDPAADMHVTVLYSKTPVDWFDMGAPWQSNEDGTLNVAPGGPRAVLALGSDGAIVLRFYSPDIQYRHDSMVDRGASHDFETFAPHVTFSHDVGDVDLDAVVPYDGELKFGPEIFEPIKPSNNDPAQYAFTAADDEAIDRLIASLVEQTSPVFEAMATELRSSLQGVTTAEGARIALLGAMERLPTDRLAQLTALPLLAERAAASIGQEDKVDA